MRTRKPLSCDWKMISVVLLVLTLLHVGAARCPQPCVSGLCDVTTGSCMVEWDGSGAVDLHPNLTAESVSSCTRGLWGADCSRRCPDNCQNAACEKDTGQCILGCQRGYTGPNCTQDCPSGFHGPNCQLPCSEHCKSASCHARTGACTLGCLAGRWGSDCSLGLEFQRSSPKEKRDFYSGLSAEGRSVLLYLLTSRYDQALARVQHELEEAVRERNHLQALLRD